MSPSDTAGWLREATATLLDRRAGPAALKRCADEIRERLSLLTGITDSAAGDIHDRSLPFGRAIGPWKAAACAMDFMRTAAFMRGVDDAIREARQRTSGPLEIVYAGTGPFALLLLPVLLHRDASPMRITMLDAHVRSCVVLRRLMSTLGLDSIRHAVICADAAEYRHPSPIDVAIVEVMQRALLHEPQVAVTLNLASQMHGSGILVPAEVNVHLGPVAADDVGNVVPGDGLQLVLSLSRATSKSLPAALASGVTLDIRSRRDRTLGLFTSITTYGEHSIGCNQSSLTSPYLIHDPALQSAEAVRVRYLVGPKPRFVLTPAEPPPAVLA